MVPVHYRGRVTGVGLPLAKGLAGAAGWLANGWRHGADTAELKRAHAEFRTTLSEAALADVQTEAATTRQAATEFATIQAWAIELLSQYATCAARHAKTVHAWPK